MSADAAKLGGVEGSTNLAGMKIGLLSSHTEVAKAAAAMLPRTCGSVKPSSRARRDFILKTLKVGSDAGVTGLATAGRGRGCARSGEVRSHSPE